MNKRLLIVALTGLVAAFIMAAKGGTEYGKTVFLDDVSVGAWTSVVSSITAGTTTGGTYTNGAYTNYYRLSGTNVKGRIGLSSNVVFTFVGNTNTTNAVVLTWGRYNGLSSYVIERSLDAGTSWSNWLTVTADTTNWTDLGTNTWSTNSTFTNLYSAAAGPAVPWLSDVSPGNLIVGTNLVSSDIDAGVLGAYLILYKASGATAHIAAHGAGIAGYLFTGTSGIEGTSYGSGISGYLRGTNFIYSSTGAHIDGYSLAGGYSIITNASHASRMSLYNTGLAVINNAVGALQMGKINNDCIITNYQGDGSIQVLAGAGTNIMTGKAALGLGSVTCSNNQAIVMGDGQQSHGNGSLTAASLWIGETSVADQIAAQLDLAGTKVLTGDLHVGTNKVVDFTELTPAGDSFNFTFPGSDVTFTFGSESGILFTGTNYGQGIFFSGHEYFDLADSTHRVREGFFRDVDARYARIPTNYIYYANSTNYVTLTSDLDSYYLTRCSNGVINIKTNSLLP